MGIYEVLLGIDRAARDTGRRISMQVCERDELSAAIKAEGLANERLPHPEVEYTHAMRVTAVTRPTPMAAPALALAA